MCVFRSNKESSNLVFQIAQKLKSTPAPAPSYDAKKPTH